MEIVNFTRFPAEVTLSTDKDGRDWYLVVLKGTYAIPDRRRPAGPAEEQAPFVYGDEHFGDPESTSIKYESEFAPFKPRPEFAVVGSAHPGAGGPVREMEVRVEVGRVVKRIRVVGDRVWNNLGAVAVAGRPEPFNTMPIRYERAYGGSDTRPKKVKRHAFELRNLVGVGVVARRGAWNAGGRPLPNLFPPGAGMSRPRQRLRPISLGFIGRSWSPRAGFAGTYDEAWRESKFPLLPDDFDPRYYQGTPEDQWLDRLRAGLPVRLHGLSPDGPVEFVLPDLSMPLRWRFRTGFQDGEMTADTLILEPDDRRFQVHWRATARVERKLLDLAQIWIGPPTGGRLIAASTGKRYVDLRSDLVPGVTP